MSIEEKKIPTKILDDLCSRFIINIPSEQRDDLVLLFFAIELAHWHYMDYYREDDQSLPNSSIKEFAQQIFHHCPFLRLHVANLDQILSQWRDYKFSVPTYGAILLDPTLEYVLLVRGFDHRESWGFPKGKIQENEAPVKCAIREVLEEVGFDIKDRICPDQYLQNERNGQIISLYIVTGVPLDTKFRCKTKNEIKDMRWFRIADLPSRRDDATPQMKLNLTAKAFFMVIPFVKDLRRWISQQREIVHSTSSHRHRSLTYHGDPTVKFGTRDKASNSTSHPLQRHFSQVYEHDSISVTNRRESTDTSLMTNGTNPILLTPPLSNDEDVKKPLMNVTNSATFAYHGPKCWRHFRLNRSAIHRCL